MELKEKIHLGLLDASTSQIRLFFLISLYALVVDTNGRCGCSSNKVVGNGFYNPDMNAVRGDPYQVSSGDFGTLDSSIGSRRQNVPVYKILHFEPTYLDFLEQSVGMPAVRTVTIVNPGSSNQIQLLSIETGAPHFHASSIKSKNLEPSMNTSFELVFLPRLPGNVENTIFIHTNRGDFPYQVFGVGISNVYRLRSYIGARIPTDGTFSPYINMYNPYGESIQVTEMYSSGGDLHLELPVSNTDTSQKVWEIPPYETKPIMKATFNGKNEGNHTSFVRIKIGKTPAQKDVLILPFDVETTSVPGIYTNIDVFDFGTLRTMDEPKSLSLNMINTSNRSVPISAITVHPPNKALSIQFSPMVLKPSKKHNRVGLITYAALHVVSRKQHSGKIVIQTGEKVRGRKEIPYHANVLQGTLAYSVGKTAFYSGNPSEKSVIQPLTITNTFNFSLVIYNGSLPSDFSHIFSIVNFTSPTTVQPGKLVSPLSIQYENNQSDLILSTILRLYTNASIFTIPIHSYTGKMKYTVDGPDEDVIDYGTVGVRENRTISFKIINKNPVEVSIKEYSCCGNIEFARLRLDFIRQGRKNKQVKRSKWIAEKKNSTNYQSFTTSEQVTLKPKEEATFSVVVVTPSKEGTYHGEVTFKTLFEEVHIPIYIKTVVGSLVSRPKRINFQKSFPGQTKSHTVFLESSFPNPLKITDIKLHPPDRRFIFSKAENNITELIPNRRTKIGVLRMDSSLGHDADCYLCLSRSGNDELIWIHSLSLQGETWEKDLKLLEKMKGKWEAVKGSKQTQINSSLLIGSEIIKNYSIPIQASLTWPSLVEQSVRFPPTYIGNYTQQELVLTNPSDLPVLIQVLPLLDYPHPQGAMDLVSDRLEEDSFAIELNGHSAFTLPDVSENSRERALIQSQFVVEPASNSIALLLKRRSKAIVNIGFKPDDDKLKTSIMVVRNNLTILELVVIQGQGARGELTINEKISGLESLLLFELKSNHLSDCNKSTAKARTFPSFTVKRTFTAKNVGQLPLHISSMNINGYECDGYGFRILNCGPFSLQPNESRKLDITFTPDFSMSRLVRTLRLISSMNTVLEFTLLATLPHHLLSLCASSLPRPFWEPYLHIIAALVMSIVFLVVIFGAYFDAQKYVLQCTFGSSYSGAVKIGRVSEIYTPGNVFNLNSIVAQKSKTPDKTDIVDGKPACKSNGFHLNLQKRISGDGQASSISRSRSSSFCSTTSETSMKSANSTPSSETIKEIENECEKKDANNDERKSKRKYGSNENIAPHHPTVDKAKNKDNESHKHGKHRKSEKESKNRRNNTDIRIYEESASNVVVQEFSILEPDMDRIVPIKQKKKIKSTQRKESKEQKKQQQQQQQQQIVREPQPTMKLRDFELVESIPNDSSFTKVESKAQKFMRKGNKIEPAPINNNQGYNGSLDKLDEIAICGPKPDMRDNCRAYKTEPLSRTKSDHSKRIDPPQRRRSLQHLIHPGSKVIYDSNGKLIPDIPTSPHAIAAAVVEAALEKSSGTKNKKNKVKLEKTSSAGSTPTSLESLSESSRSSSYSSIVSNDNPIMKLFGSTQGNSQTSNRNTSSPLLRDDSRSSSGHSSPVNQQCRSPTEPESLSAYIRRLAVGIHPGREIKPKSKAPVIPPSDSQNSNSMFYYDNLSSLRATKKPITDELEHLRKAPGTKLWSTRDRTNKTELDPASKEFVPKSMRSSKPAFMNGSVSPTWPENRKMTAIQPPPGLSRSARISDIWGLDNASLSSDSSSRRGWDSFQDDTFKNETTAKLRHRAFNSDRYSVLLPQPDTDKPHHSDFFDSQYNSFGQLSPTEPVNDPWVGNSVIDEISQRDGSWSTPGIRPSIWSNSRSYSADDGQISRSLLGLDLSLPSYNTGKDKAIDRSPVDHLSVIWDPSEDSIDIPYEGWSEDIKEE